LTRASELRFSSANMDDKTVRSGSSFELKCEVYSVPPPVFTWTLNGKEIAGVHDANLFEKLSNIGKSTLQNGVVTSRIRIPCAEKKHRGKYRCIANNGHHTIESCRLCLFPLPTNLIWSLMWSCSILTNCLYCLLTDPVFLILSNSLSEMLRYCFRAILRSNFLQF
uniref:Ig-like domain-containing protein n=1 Tax=Angiostrongylus cantonensis TaxID=6313 RepID=A0A0K0D633_ANGCA